MANEPQQVDLLRADRSLILSVKESHSESMNSLGSEDTRIARIVGRSGCVASFFDDQLFRTDQNSLQITKTTDEPIEVPIATNFLSGEQHNGIYFGSRSGYNWIFSKHIAEHSSWLDIISKGVELVLTALLTNGDSTNQGTVPGTQGDSVDGLIPKSSGDASDNNRVDNLSSLRFGGEAMTNTSDTVARLMANIKKHTS